MQSRIEVNEKKIAGRIIPSHMIDEDYLLKNFSNDHIVMGLVAIIKRLEADSFRFVQARKGSDSQWNTSSYESGYDGYDDDV